LGIPIITVSVSGSLITDSKSFENRGISHSPANFSARSPEREKTFNREQVPWLGDLPVVGNLFKTTQRQDNNQELLIFVTPKILRGDLTRR